MSKIFVIDDSLSVICGYKVKLFKEMKHDFITTTEPLKAIDIALEQKPDIIISNFIMPDLNGWSLLREIRRTDSLKMTPLYLQTYSCEESREKWFKDSARIGLIDGFHIGLLNQQIIQKWLDENHLT